MWKRAVDGRPLTFRLAGINNQNFLMRDEETGSFWQQISGLAVSGPYRGRQLELVHSDEITFAMWRAENLHGTVLAPVGPFVAQYETKDWDVQMRKARTVVRTDHTPYGPRDLMLGVTHRGAARAYLLERVLAEKLVQDRIGGSAVIVVVGQDGSSVRVFEAAIPDQAGLPEFYRKPGDSKNLLATILVDSLTGSEWNFQGCAVSGTATGRCLRPIPALKDYWFDWQLYHPKTSVYGK